MPRPDSPVFCTTFDIAAIAQEMTREDAYSREGHAARTVVRTPDLRCLLIAMKPGARIAEHVAASTVTIQVVTGRARIRLPRLARQHEDRFEELEPGRVLVLDGGIAHNVEALDDTTLLVTLGRPAERAADQGVTAES